MNRRQLASSVLILAALAATGCPDAWRRAQKQPTSALWVAPGQEPIATSTTARLKEAGVGELFLEVARLDPESGQIERFEITEVPPVSATLVVKGEWQTADAEELAERVHAELRELRFEAEKQGLIPAGFHFDLRRVDDFANLARFLAEIRDLADRTLFLSLSLPRPWLSREGWQELLEPVDFVVPFLYGQRVHEREDAAAWDFVEVQKSLERLEDLAKPYLVGVVTLGTATHLGASGKVRGRTTLASLQDIVWNEAFELEPGFALDGVNRRVYTLQARQRARIGRWELEPGDGVRVVRSSTSDLEELLRLLGAWGLEHHLGQVYYRLPKEVEAMSLQLDNLWNALDPAPAAPDLRLEATVQRRSGRGWIFRFAIDNLNGEITDLSLIDNNYLQITAQQGTFYREAGRGDFFRYDLGDPQPDGSFKRNLRPNAIRFHAPILDGRQRLETGDVELRYARGDPELELEARFLLPDGRSVQFGPYTWRDGRLQDGRDEDGHLPERGSS